MSTDFRPAPVPTEEEWRSSAQLCRLYVADRVYGRDVRIVPEWDDVYDEINQRLQTAGVTQTADIEALAEVHKLPLISGFCEIVAKIANVIRVTVYPHEGLPSHVTDRQAAVSDALITLLENLPAMAVIAEYAERATPHWAKPSVHRERAEALKKLQTYAQRAIPYCVMPGGPGTRFEAWHMDGEALYRILMRWAEVARQPIGLVNEDAKGVLFARDILALGGVQVCDDPDLVAGRIKNLFVKIRREDREAGARQP